MENKLIKLKKYLILFIFFNLLIVSKIQTIMSEPKKPQKSKYEVKN